MPWPPRLLLSPPLLPLLTVIILSSTSPPIPASALSYDHGQPEYPSQPELTSDRDALARIFIQGLLEKEGKSRIPHGYSNGEESDAWVGNGQSLKRSDGANSNGQRNLISLQDVYPRILHEKAYADIRGNDNALKGQDEDLFYLDPRSEKERIVSELLARGHPSYAGHRSHGFVDPSQLSEDPDGQKLKLKEFLGVVMGDDDIPTEFLRDYDERHRTRSPLKGGSGDWSVGRGVPYPFANKKTVGDDDGVWGRSSAVKRDPFGINARGFHDDVFNRDFGSFNPMKRVARDANEYARKEEDERRELERAERQQRNKTRINGSSNGGTDKDVVSRRVKRSTVDELSGPKPLTKPDTTLPDKAKDGATVQIPLNREERAADDGKTTDGESNRQSKRRPEMDSSGFHGDTFKSGFGDFWTMKRNIHHLRPSGVLIAESLNKRRPEMDSSGFHGDTFNSGFGDFWTMKRMADGVYPPGHDGDGVSSVGKRRPEMDSSGFHGDTFSSGFGDFYTMKRNPGDPRWADKEKRRPEMDSSGFHGDTFNGGFGDFWTMKRAALAHPLSIPGKRRPEMDSSGFHGDTFNSGFGDFWTMKRTALAHPLGSSVKRRPEMDSSGFHGDTFNGGFGDFWTMKRDGAFGAANALRGLKTRNGRTGEDWDAEGEDEYDGLDAGKRRPEMDSSGFHGDTFNGGFGDFWTMKRGRPSAYPRMRREVWREEKRRPEMDASGFHGDTSNGFGDFWTLKRSGGGENFPARWAVGKLESKRRPEMDSSGFHGDTFNGGFGDFWTMKRSHLLPYPARFANSKRIPEMDSSGFHGDTFNGGFGDFWTMKRGEELGITLPGRGSLLHPSKRKPEMDSSGFHGDTFNGGFGDFWTMKRGSGGKDDERTKQELEEREEEEDREAKGSEGSEGSPGVYGAKEGRSDSGEKVIGKEKEEAGESGEGSGKSEAKSDDIKN